MNTGADQRGARARGQVVFFWDYDAQWGGDRSRVPGGRKDWGLLEFENTERLLELHETWEIPACFAVVGAVALPGARPYHDPDQVRRIHDSGHEVASHSFRHDWLPGLNRKELRESLARSKDALEQCIGAEVVTFVPPWNQPFDHPPGWSFSWSERREVQGERTDLPVLCRTLRETGYRFCRVAYRSVFRQLRERVLRRPAREPSAIERIEGVHCVRLNTPGGFEQETFEMVERVSREGGIAVVYGHPHSIRSGNSQDEQWLEPLMRRVHEIEQEGRIEVALPRELIERHQFENAAEAQGRAEEAAIEDGREASLLRAENAGSA